MRKWSAFLSWLAVVQMTPSVAFSVEPTAAEVPPTAPRNGEPAEGWFREALEAYDRGDFEIAAHLFRAVYEATRSPEVLYDLAQAERRAGDCVAALAHYEEYVRLDSGQAPEDTARKIEEMRACARRAHSPPVAAAAVPSVSSSATPDPAPPIRPNHTLRVIAFGTAVGAVVSAALGGLQLLEARSARADLEAIDRGDEWSPQYASHEDALERANRAAAGLFVTAGVLAATATTTFILSHPRDDAPPTAVVRAGVGGHGVTLAISF